MFLPRRRDAAGTVIHLVNPMRNAHGGSENRTLELARLLSARTDVRVWSPRRVAPELRDRVPLRRIRAPFWYPCGGTVVFVGAYFRPGSWLRLARPHRLVLIYNTPVLADLHAFLDSLRRAGVGMRPEFVYAADWMREVAGLPGLVHSSPIDLSRFVPAGGAPGRQRPFTVGRLSRDIAAKHHPDDVSLWREIADRGVHVRLMGATCIADRLNHPLIEILPAGAEPAESFLRQLDTFVYRTNDELFLEPSGRVVLEAMACGLPVVVGDKGGFRAQVVDGVNGFVFSSNEVACRRLDELRANPDLYDRISRSAREHACREMAPGKMQAQLDFYLSPSTPTGSPGRDGSG
jgi:glycosyltransferase involved in cell wall biosynthesis